MLLPCCALLLRRACVLAICRCCAHPKSGWRGCVAEKFHSRCLLLLRLLLSVPCTNSRTLYGREAKCYWHASVQVMTRSSCLCISAYTTHGCLDFFNLETSIPGAFRLVAVWILNVASCWLAAYLTYDYLARSEFQWNPMFVFVGIDWGCVE